MSHAKDDSLKEIVKLLGDSSGVVVGTHISPDSDAVGSSISFVLALKSLGIPAIAIFEDGPPRKLLRFCPVDSYLTIASEQGLESLKAFNFDTFLGVDCATQDRLGQLVSSLQLLERAKMTINIDHHRSNEGWAKKNFVEGTASSTAELVVPFLSALGAPITPEIANLCYAGILEDTGSFRYSNTSPSALRTAADLVELGADPAIVSEQLYYTMSEGVVLLRSEVASKLKIFAGGKAASVFVTDSMLEKFSCTAEDTEGLVDIPRSISGVKIAIFAREIKDGFKLSLRSSDATIDVDTLAKKYGGGGHRAAAGCKIQGTLLEVMKEIERVIEALF